MKRATTCLSLGLFMGVIGMSAVQSTAGEQDYRNCIADIPHRLQHEITKGGAGIDAFRPEEVDAVRQSLMRECELLRSQKNRTNSENAQQ